MFEIHMGVPEMKQFWSDLQNKVKTGNAKKNEIKKYKIIGKALYLLAQNSKYPGLNSHEISALTARYGQKVWESYLQNNAPAAGRIFWVYGPGQNSITVIGIEPHPNDKSNAYQKITLSAAGEEMK